MENTNDKKLHGTCVSVIMLGEDARNRKLDNSKVLKIRELNERGESYPSIAKQFGVSTAAIFNVVKRLSWAHI